MRFLLEFASCCGCAPRPLPVHAMSSSSHYYGDKQRTFIPRRPTTRSTPRRPRHVVKRRTLAGPGQWKPMLVPIFEDDNNSNNNKDDDDDEVATGKRKSDASMALLCDYNPRRAGASKIISGFYPMPYMF